MDSAIGDHRNVFPMFEKLHDLRAFSGHLCPARFGGRILLQPAQLSSGNSNVYLFEFLAGRPANTKGVVFEGNRLEVLGAEPGATLPEEFRRGSPRLDDTPLPPYIIDLPVAPETGAFPKT